MRLSDIETGIWNVPFPLFESNRRIISTFSSWDYYNDKWFWLYLVDDDTLRSIGALNDPIGARAARENISPRNFCLGFLTKWCEENLAENFSINPWPLKQWEFYFSDPTDAMMFALTFKR